MRSKASLFLSAALASFTVNASAQTFDHKGITFGGGDFRLRVDGRVHLDTVAVNDDLTLFEDQTRVRRGRLAASVRLASRWNLKVDRELSSYNEGWRNLWISYDVTDDLTLKVGNVNAPLLGENIKSSNDIKMIERSLSSSLAPNFLVGGMAHWSNDNWSLAGGYYENSLSFDAVDPRDDGRSFIGRAAFAPIRKRGENLHLAVGFDHRTLETNTVSRERALPEFGLGFTRLVDTRNLEGVESYLTMAAEAGYSRGPFLLQGQYLQRNVDAPTLDDPTYSGWSVTGAWVLTGERQRYSMRNGAFSSVRPRRDLVGAVELVGRVGSIDLSDGLVSGGEQTNMSVGLNWYLSRNLRVMVNGVHTDAKPNRNGLDETAQAAIARVQVAF